MCPDCDEELDENNYCEECSKTWTEKELDDHQEKENEAYVKWCKEQHPEWFDNKKKPRATTLGTTLKNSRSER